MMRYTLLVILLSSTLTFAQSQRYNLTEKDTLITCAITSRSTVTGPFVDTHATDLENLITTVFDASPLPKNPYTLLRSKDAALFRLGCHTYDDREYRTYLLYNIDSAAEFNLKARTRYGLMSVLAHEVGHNAFNHFLPWPHTTIMMQELQADYFAGWLLAKLHVPADDATKGIASLVTEKTTNAAYPKKKARIDAMTLGFTIGTQTEISVLTALETGTPLNDAWLKKWGRLVTMAGTRSPLTETSFANTSLELDAAGQLLYMTKEKTFAIARAIPSKDGRYAYLLFDNQFHYWWITRDGVIRDSNDEKTLAHVNLSVLQNRN
jgi:hypothetical protein